MSVFKQFIKAVKEQDLETVKQLFKEEFIHENLDGLTALHHACVHTIGPAIVVFLLDNGWDIECVTIDDRRVTPIHLAAQKGRFEIAGTLLRSGCNTSCLTSEGETPRDIAYRLRNKKMVDLLESHEGNNNSGSIPFSKENICEERMALNNIKDKEDGRRMNMDENVQINYQPQPSLPAATERSHYPLYMDIDTHHYNTTMNILHTHNDTIQPINNSQRNTTNTSNLDKNLVYLPLAYQPSTESTESHCASLPYSSDNTLIKRSDTTFIGASDRNIRSSTIVENIAPISASIMWIDSSNQLTVPSMWTWKCIKCQCDNSWKILSCVNCRDYSLWYLIRDSIERSKITNEGSFAIKDVTEPSSSLSLLCDQDHKEEPWRDNKYRQCKTCNNKINCIDEIFCERCTAKRYYCNNRRCGTILKKGYEHCCKCGLKKGCNVTQYNMVDVHDGNKYTKKWQCTFCGAFSGATKCEHCKNMRLTPTNKICSCLWVNKQSANKCDKCFTILKKGFDN